MLNKDELPMHVEYFRKRRSALLAESDWTQLPDAPLTAEQKAEWAAYRQQLRDFPSLFTDDIEELPALPIAPNVVIVTEAAPEVEASE